MKQKKILFKFIILVGIALSSFSYSQEQASTTEDKIKELVKGWTALITQKTGMEPTVTVNPDLALQAGLTYNDKEVSFYFTKGLLDKSEDVALLIACHKIGQVLGKVYMDPKPGNTKKSATRGESDYFGGMCLRKYFERHPKNISSNYNICKQSAACNYVIQTALTMFNGEPTKENFSEQTLLLNLPKVTTTIQTYPSNQCRFQTIYAGIIMSGRPACWYFKTGSII